MNAQESAFDIPTRPLELSNFTKEEYAPRKRSKPKWPIYLGIALLLFIIIGLIAYNFKVSKINNKSITVASSQTSNKTTPQAPSPTKEAIPTPTSTPSLTSEIVPSPQITEEILPVEEYVQATESSNEEAIEAPIENPLSKPLLATPKKSVIRYSDSAFVDTEEYKLAQALYLEGYKIESSNKKQASQFWQQALQYAPDGSKLKVKIAKKLSSAQAGLAKFNHTQ